MSLEEDDVKWPVSGTSILELEDQSKFRATLILEVGEGTTDALSLERTLDNGSLKDWGFLLDLFSILGIELLWGLTWISDLEHWMWLLFFCFALGAEIKIRSYTAFISDTNDRVNVAAIADESWVSNLLLMSFNTTEMLLDLFG